MMFKAIRFLVVLVISLLVGSGVVLAQKKYGPGVTDTEIKIGQTQPYSGPAWFAEFERQCSVAKIL